MRKILNIFVAVALAVAASATFAACGDDDEPDAPEKEKTVKEATLVTGLYVNQAILDAYEITGTSSQGKELTFSAKPVDVTVSGGEVVPMYAMEAEATSKSVPFTSIMNFKFELKDGYKVPEKNDFALAFLASGSIVYTDGSKVPFVGSGYSVYNKGVFGSKIDAYTETINRTFGSLEAELDEDGITLN